MDLGVMMLLNLGMGSAMQLSAAEVQRLQMESAQLVQIQLEQMLRQQAIEAASAQMPRMDPLVPRQPPLK